MQSLHYLFSKTGAPTSRASSTLEASPEKKFSGKRKFLDKFTSKRKKKWEMFLQNGGNNDKTKWARREEGYMLISIGRGRTPLIKSTSHNDNNDNNECGNDSSLAIYGRRYTRTGYTWTGYTRLSIVAVIPACLYNRDDLLLVLTLVFTV